MSSNQLNNNNNNTNKNNYTSIKNAVHLGLKHQRKRQNKRKRFEEWLCSKMPCAAEFEKYFLANFSSFLKEEPEHGVGHPQLYLSTIARPVTEDRLKKCEKLAQPLSPLVLSSAVIDWIEKCISQGLNVNKQYFNGWTLAFLAIGLNSAKLLRMLIKNGARLDIVDKSGYYPIYYANKLDLLEICAQHGTLEAHESGKLWSEIHLGKKKAIHFLQGCDPQLTRKLFSQTQIWSLALSRWNNVQQSLQGISGQSYNFAQRSRLGQTLTAVLSKLDSKQDEQLIKFIASLALTTFYPALIKLIKMRKFNSVEVIAEKEPVPSRFVWLEILKVRPEWAKKAMALKPEYFKHRGFCVVFAHRFPQFIPKIKKLNPKFPEIITQFERNNLPSQKAEVSFESEQHKISSAEILARIPSEIWFEIGSYVSSFRDVISLMQSCKLLHTLFTKGEKSQKFWLQDLGVRFPSFMSHLKAHGIKSLEPSHAFKASYGHQRALEDFQNLKFQYQLVPEQFYHYIPYERGVAGWIRNQPVLSTITPTLDYSKWEKKKIPVPFLGSISNEQLIYFSGDEKMIATAGNKLVTILSTQHQFEPAKIPFAKELDRQPSAFLLSNNMLMVSQPGGIVVDLQHGTCYAHLNCNPPFFPSDSEFEFVSNSGIYDSRVSLANSVLEFKFLGQTQQGGGQLVGNIFMSQARGCSEFFDRRVVRDEKLFSTSETLVCFNKHVLITHESEVFTSWRDWKPFAFGTSLETLNVSNIAPKTNPLHWYATPSGYSVWPNFFSFLSKPQTKEQTA